MAFVIRKKTKKYSFSKKNYSVTEINPKTILKNWIIITVLLF